MRERIELSQDLLQFDNSPSGLSKLRHHIMRNWTVGEVIAFREAALPGLSNHHGKTEPALCRLFREAAIFCYLHLGAACMLEMEPATIQEMTPHSLGRSIPPTKRNKLDMAIRLARIEEDVAKTATIATETRQGVGVLVQRLPDAKTLPHIEEKEAVAIMKQKGGTMTDRTLRNWLKAGVAGRVKQPITWSDLASVASWSAWVKTYLIAENTRLTRKSFISEHAGTVEAEKSRRRSPTA